MNTSIDINNENVTCHECGLNVNIPQLNEQEKALCPRCHYVIARKHTNSIERIIVFSITSLLFLLISLPFDFLSFSSRGLEQQMSIITSFITLIEHDYLVLALLEFITVYTIPLLILIGLLYILIPAYYKKYPMYAHEILRLIFKLIPWSMAEIFLVGTLVSLIKLSAMAEISLGPSFFAFLFFSIFITATILHIDRRELFKLLDDLLSKKQQINKASNKNVLPKQVISKHILLKASLNKRKPKLFVYKKRAPIQNNITNDYSIQQTWALLITAIILYIPANLLPIMNTSVLGQDDPSTILQGVVLLWQMGSIPIAIIIFIASIVVPVAKIIVLIWLNYSIQTQSNTLTMERIKMYRLAEFIGRWSMVDVYVVIILVSLIQLGNSISIYPGNATLAFSAVVILTMLAAMTFNSKKIWQTLETIS